MGEEIAGVAQWEMYRLYLDRFGFHFWVCQVLIYLLPDLG